MKYVIPAVVAISVMLIILLSFIMPSPALMAMRLGLVDWAVMVAALAVLLGVINLLIVHTRRMASWEKGSAYSLLTVLAVLMTLAIGGVEMYLAGGSVLYEPTSLTNVLFRGVVAASMAALGSLVMFFLVTSAVKLLQTRLNGWSILFLVVVVVALVGWIPLRGLGLLGGLRSWIITVPAVAGARGIMLGVALGTLFVGLRFLTGSERPYKD